MKLHSKLLKLNSFLIHQNVSVLLFSKDRFSERGNREKEDGKIKETGTVLSCQRRLVACFQLGDIKTLFRGLFSINYLAI